MNRLSKSDIGRLQQSSRNFDERTQSGDQAHLHSLARRGQSDEDAIRMRDEFINDTLNQAKNLAKKGDRNGALDLLGEACHPIMDWSSPEHTKANGKPRTWNPMWPFGHSPNESIGNETYRAVTPAMLEQQRLLLNNAYDTVFGRP